MCTGSCCPFTVARVYTPSISRTISDFFSAEQMPSRRTIWFARSWTFRFGAGSRDGKTLTKYTSYIYTENAVECITNSRRLPERSSADLAYLKTIR